MSYREILLTARIMDEIFAQIYPAKKSERPVVAANEMARPAVATPMP
jgi:hypothetical protein